MGRGLLQKLAAACLLLFPAQAFAQWSDLGGGDHGGDDWIPGNGAVIGGVHTNVGAFVIEPGATVSVAEHDGVSGGTLVVHACTITVDGTVTATAAGQIGGARSAASGGHQGAGPGAGCGGGPGSCVANGGAGAGYGGAGGQTAAENNYGGACGQCDVPVDAHCDAAAGGTYGTSDGADLEMGSSGGAGGNGCGCADAGPRGGDGGGAITLLALDVMAIGGTIAADGEEPPLDDAACGYHPGGGGGSGGGVLLEGGEIAGNGTITAAGGHGGYADGCPSSCNDWAWAGGGGGGGRIKLFAGTDAFAGTLGASGGGGGTTPVGNQNYNGQDGSFGTTHRDPLQPADGSRKHDEKDEERPCLLPQGHA